MLPHLEHPSRRQSSAIRISPVMPPRTALSTPLRAWRCPQCTSRTFSSTVNAQAVGPAHPDYIAVPTPPQQTLPDRKFIKGRLPVPRDVFAGAKGKDKSSDEWLDEHTQPPKEGRNAQAGSRIEWRHKMSDMRRRNLREGLASLRARKDRVERTQAERSARHRRERDELLNKPEREDERLTTPSHGLDLETLFKGKVEDPTRSARIAFKQQKLAETSQAKHADRLDSLHTLYLNARTFIVTPSQLDRAVDEAFGTPENPVTFGDQSFGPTDNSASVWAYGKPERVQDMLNKATRQGGKTALESAGGYSGVNRERIRRIGEVLTGGRMGDEGEARR